MNQAQDTESNMNKEKNPKEAKGHLHPHSTALAEVYKIFTGLGFSISEGPEIEDEYHNFDALNVPADHPSRDMQDTFWLKNHPSILSNEKDETGHHFLNDKKRTLLRTQTSSIQVRYMEKLKHEGRNPPFNIIGGGKVFRNEATDKTHEAQFYQIEGMSVGKDISVATLKSTLKEFFNLFFGNEIEIRFRPSYFPFVEPGVEVDVLFNGKWLEVLGAGMVHPVVLNAGGIDSKLWQGFAFGIGLDRLLMIRHNITDVRMLYSGDLRFINQF